MIRIYRGFIFLLLLAFCGQIFAAPIGLSDQIKARLEVTIKPPFWYYTVFNDEPIGSDRYIVNFYFDIAAP